MPAPVVSATSGSRAAPAGRPATRAPVTAARAWTRVIAPLERPRSASSAAQRAAAGGVLRLDQRRQHGQAHRQLRGVVGLQARGQAAQRRVDVGRAVGERRDRVGRADAGQRAPGVAIVAAQQHDDERPAGAGERADGIARQAAGDHGDAAAQLVRPRGGERCERPAVAAAGQQRAGEGVDDDPSADQRQRPRTRGRRFAQQLAQASYDASVHLAKP